MRQLNNEELSILRYLSNKSQKKLTVAIYARKSREDESNSSLSSQIDDCKALINRYSDIFDLKNLKIYKEDEASGFSLNRKEFRKVLDGIKSREINVLVAVSMDRLTRSVDDFSKISAILKENDAVWLSTNLEMASNALQRLSQTIIASVNEFTAIQYIERGIEGKRSKFEQGFFPGGVPNYGYKIVEGKYYQDEDEAPAVKLIFEMVIGGKSYSEIQEELFTRGYKPKGQGSKFAHSQIKGIITNERNYGKNVYMPDEYSDKRKSNKFYPKIRNDKTVVEPIISKEIFEKANLIQKTKSKGRQSPNRVYLLTGITYTEDTGESMAGNSSSVAKGRNSYYSYQKPRSSKSMVKQVNALELEETVIEVMKKLVGDYIKKNDIQEEFINKKIKEVKERNIKLRRLIREKVKSTEKLVEELIKNDKETVKTAIRNNIEKNDKVNKEYEKRIRKNSRLIKKYEALKEIDLLNLELTNDVLKGAELKSLIHVFIEKIVITPEGTAEIKIK